MTATPSAAAPLTEESIQSLRERLRGEAIAPSDPAYDEARRVYNAMHDRRPALVVRAVGVADVLATVRFTAERGLPLAIRGGGHSVPGFGTCEGGIVVDLACMRGVRVDPARQTLRAEGGCTWGDVNHAAHAFGLATTGGIVSTTGIAGLTLGGGMGYLMRSLGLSCDNLVSADVVTADGSFLTCSEEENGDLFWALQGGGGNFGVVTSFEYRLHPVNEIYGGPIFFPLEAGVLQGWREFIFSAPEPLGAVLGLTLAPPLPFLPREWHGKPVCALIVCWPGKAAEGESLLTSLREWGPIVGSHVGPMPYPVINTLFDDLVPAGLQQYWKGSFAHELSDAAIPVHLEHASRTPCPESGTFLFPMDGATRRVAPDAAAFANRDVALANVVAGAWPDPRDNEANVRWVRAYHAALVPHSEEGGYVNFMDVDDQGRAAVNYRESYARLRRVKRKYDPENLFRINHNIPPR